MKIYVAGSYRAMNSIRVIGEMLRTMGHQAYVFCDEKEPAFAASMTIRSSSLPKRWTHVTALEHPLVRDIYTLNKAEIDKADAVVMVLPCGKSSHLEAGYAKGLGKLVIAYGLMEEGEFDAMYGFFEKVFSTEQGEQFLSYFLKIAKEEHVTLNRKEQPVEGENKGQVTERSDRSNT